MLFQPRNLFKPTKTAKDVRKQVGAQLKKLRTDAKLTRRVLASQVNITEDRLESYERGLSTCPPSLLRRLKKAISNSYIKDVPDIHSLLKSEPPKTMDFSPSSDVAMLREQIATLNDELQTLKEAFIKLCNKTEGLKRQASEIQNFPLGNQLTTKVSNG